MRDRQIQRLALGGLMAALVLLLTAALKLPVPATGGYIHLGDGMIFLAAWLLGPYAALCAAVGSALADLLGGYFIYIAPTFLIKGAMGYLAGKTLRTANVPMRVAILILAELIMVAGYFLFEGVTMSWAAAIAAVPANLIQGAGGVLFGLGFCVLGKRLPQF
ncbi:MAG TPA: ECF transporter S component [Clostridia bacterium]|nr:ECF transporter S component [Clostridia bacterium]